MRWRSIYFPSRSIWSVGLSSLGFRRPPRKRRTWESPRDRLRPPGVCNFRLPLAAGLANAQDAPALTRMLCSHTPTTGRSMKTLRPGPDATDWIETKVDRNQFETCYAAQSGYLDEHLNATDFGCSPVKLKTLSELLREIRSQESTACTKAHPAKADKYRDWRSAD